MVRVDDALGVAGRAARELDDRDVAGVRELGRGRVGPAFEPLVHRDHARPVDRRLRRVAGDDDQLDLRRGRRALSSVGSRSSRATRTLRSAFSITRCSRTPRASALSGHGDASGRLRAVERGEELDLVAQEEADVARAAEVVDERVGEAVGLLLGLLERQAAVGEVQPRLVRPLLDLVLQDVQHRALLDREAARERAGAGALAFVELDHERRPGTRRRVPCGRRW